MKDQLITYDSINNFVSSRRRTCEECTHDQPVMEFQMAHFKAHLNKLMIQSVFVKIVARNESIRDFLRANHECLPVKVVSSVIQMAA